MAHRLSHVRRFRLRRHSFRISLGRPRRCFLLFFQSRRSDARHVDSAASRELVVSVFNHSTFPRYENHRFQFNKFKLIYSPRYFHLSFYDHLAIRAVCSWARHPVNRNRNRNRFFVPRLEIRTGKQDRTKKSRKSYRNTGQDFFYRNRACKQDSIQVFSPIKYCIY